MIVSQRRLRRPARRGRAHPRAGLRAVHRHGPGACGGRGLGAHLQPQLPGSQRHAGRPRLPLLARDRGGDRARRRRSPIRATLGEPPALRAPPPSPELDDRPDRRCRRRPSRRGRSKLEKGPNIVPPPPVPPLPDEISGRVLIVVPDDVSTGDMAPDGALGLAIWSNIPACAATCSAASTPTSRRGRTSGAAASSSAATTTARARAASRPRSPRSTSACARSSPRASPASTART